MRDVVTKKCTASAQFPGGVRCSTPTWELPEVDVLTNCQEAFRVFTPPLKEENSDGKMRGFFFDVSAPTSALDSGSTSSHRTKTSGNSQRKAQPVRPREWWDGPKTAGRRDPTSMFEFDIPEHLPNSPMCPANPKHKSKGRGVCVVSDAAPS